MSTKKEYVIIDHEGFVSTDDEGEPQVWFTWKSAEKRASEMALAAPGKKICIFELTAEVVWPVADKVDVGRLHPREHYKP